MSAATIQVPMEHPLAVDWRHGAPLPPGYPQVLPELFAAARTRTRAPVIIAAGEQADWDWLDTAAGRIAAAWAERIRPGDRIAVILPNGIDHLIAELAAWRLGAVVAPVWSGLGRGCAAAVAQTRAVLTVTDDGTFVPAEVPWVDRAELRRLADHGPVAEARLVSPDDPCLLLATSGSSGSPRGVLLSQRNLCTQQAAFAALWPDVGPADRLAAHLPWHHSFGSLAERLWSLCRGCALHVVSARDQPAFLNALAVVRPTVFMSVPKMHRIATTADALDCANLRWAFTAGAVLGAREEAWYHDRAIPLFEGWGLTETSPSACVTPPSEPRTLGCVGRPIPGVSVGVRGDGRILVAGPGVMLGYDDDPLSTALVTGHDRAVGRWIDSGDVGAWTTAGLHLEGRADLMIKLDNGETVELGPLACRLEGAPGVRQAVVFTRDHRVIEAVVAPLPGTTDAHLVAAIASANHDEILAWRRIRRIWRLDLEPRSDNGLLTASLKICREAWLRSVADGTARQLKSLS